MTSRVYELMEDLSSSMIAIYPVNEVKDMNDELAELLQKGETEGNFRSVILDQYYAEFVKGAIRYYKKIRNTSSKVSDSPYFHVLEILFNRYRVDPDNEDEKGKTPVEYAVKLKCPKFVEYLVSKGSKGPPKKARKKTPKKKATKKCDYRAITGRCVNGTKQSRKCYRNDKTKRCRKRQ